MSRECPVDHESTERAVDRLPRPVRNGVYVSLGWLSVAAGVVGVLIPVWPTTCFLLLAGWCFARSSKRAERWLYRNRWFGGYLRAYRERGIISSRVRGASLAALWASIAVSAYFVIERLWLVALLVLVAGSVTVHLCSLPTERRTAKSQVGLRAG